METLQETLDLLRPSNAIGENLIPFKDFVENCAHLFEEDTFKERFSNLLSKEGNQEQIIRVLIDNYQFGGMTRVFNDETNEEFVVEWEF